LVEIMSERLRRPDRPEDAPCGCAALGRSCLRRLLASQAWALWEIPLARDGEGGLLGQIRVGGGKTLLNILAPMVLPGCRVAVLLVPPGLVGQLELEYLAAAEHFRVPSLVLPGARGGYIIEGRPILRVVPYSQFQVKGSTRLLEDFMPDSVIADEVDALKNPESTRTGRVLRYFEANPAARFCGWSGTIASRSILDFAHLILLALRGRSPLPIDPEQIRAWASAVDPSDFPAPAGVLRAFGVPVVEGLGRRVRETFGFVSTGANAKVPAKPVLREWAVPRLPEALATMRRDLRSTWTRPDGEELVRAVEVERAAQQLALGFYYRWRFPGNPSDAVKREWFEARRAYGRAMREVLMNPRPHLDSKYLATLAAERAERGSCSCGATFTVKAGRVEMHTTPSGKACEYPAWRCPAWVTWRDVKDTLPHTTEAVWVDETLARLAGEWASTRKALVWYEDRAFGEKVAKVSGLPLHAGGPTAEAEILAERGDRSLVVSVGAHGRGRDGLQRVFAEELIVAPQPDARGWEQLLGRLNRQGQTTPEVITYVARYVPEFRDSIDRAVRVAKWTEGLMTSAQILLAADVEWLNAQNAR
jgi:hypothetical protein